MKSLWLVVYVADVVLVFFVIPVAMFYYEGDQDKIVEKRMKSVLKGVASSVMVRVLTLGILYECADKTMLIGRVLSGIGISSAIVPLHIFEVVDNVGIAIVPSVLLALGMLFSPESPRQLVQAPNAYL